MDRPLGGPARTGRLPETTRAANYQTVTNEYARSNVNLIALFAHQWWSAEVDPGVHDHWTGIANHEADANPITLKLSGQAYSNQAMLFRGKTSDMIPRATVYISPDRPAPDQDGDGVIDEDDDYPLDATQS